MNELTKIDVNDVRAKYLSNPSFVFRRGIPNLFELSMAIAEGAFYLGCSKVEIEVFKDWQIVKGNHDWICENPVKSEIFFFDHLVPFPELDINSAHWEFYLSVYCVCILTAKDEIITVIKENEYIALEINQALESVPIGWRAVAFKL